MTGRLLAGRDSFEVTAWSAILTSDLGLDLDLRVALDVNLAPGQELPSGYSVEIHFEHATDADSVASHFPAPEEPGFTGTVLVEPFLPPRVGPARVEVTILAQSMGKSLPEAQTKLDHKGDVTLTVTYCADPHPLPSRR
ncbi:MAG: hypothetical protein ACK47B_11410 [Armatimonadota bacterium]